MYYTDSSAARRTIATTTTLGSYLPLAGGTMTGSAISSAGSAALPSVGIGQTTSGLFSGGTNILGLSTAGVERMRVDASGNVGIGTTSPAYALDINGSIRSKGSVETVIAAGTCSTSYNIDPTVGTMINLTLNGACTIGISNLAAGHSFSVKLTQSSTTAPTFSTTYKWPSGTAPTWSTSATKYDVFACASFDGVTLQCNVMQCLMKGNNCE